MRTDPDRPTLSLPRGVRRRVAVLLATLFAAVAAAGIRAASAASSDGGADSIAWPAGSIAATGNTVLSISGSWPTACTPTFDKASLDGADLRIDARAVLSLCTRQATPYAIELNPLAALGQATLPAAVYHVYYYAANGAQAEPRLHAFALVDATADAKGA